MNARELFNATGETAGIYYCDKCRIVNRTREGAESCCAPTLCNICQEPCKQYWTLCESCNEKSRKELELNRFQKAEKVTDFYGWLYWDGHGDREGYFPSFEELEDYLFTADEDIERPEYVWTCNPTHFCQIDFDRIVENISEEAYEDWDSTNINGRKEIKAAIEVFNDGNKEICSYNPNYKKALILQPMTHENRDS